MRTVDVTVSFDEGSVIIDEESWRRKLHWMERKMEKTEKDPDWRTKKEVRQRRSFKVIPKQYIVKKTPGWLKCNNDLKETSSIFALEEQMIETRVWKKLRVLVECSKCRLCGENWETVHHFLFGYNKIVGTEYVKRHNNTLKVLAVKWTVENELLPEDTKWYKRNWERRKVIEKDGKKLFWDWEHTMRTDCIVCRSDFIPYIK